MMFVHDFEIVDRPYDDVAYRFRSGVEQSLEAAFSAARTESEQLRSRVAPLDWPGVLATTVDVRAGRVRDFEASMIVAFSWETSEDYSLLPMFEGDIEIAPFGLDRTSVTIRGTYDLPGEALIKGIDRLVLTRLAESTVRAFLDGLCALFGRAWVQ